MFRRPNLLIPTKEWQVGRLALDEGALARIRKPGQEQKILTCSLQAAYYVIDAVYVLLFRSTKQVGGYMKPEYRELRLKQLAATLERFTNAKQTARPVRGWLRAVREALGVSQQEVAIAAKVKRQSIIGFEEAEASDRITLRNLRRVADAMGCELVYAIVPKSGSIQELAE